MPESDQNLISDLVNSIHFNVPKCTCGQVEGFTAVITPEYTTVSPWRCNGWRDCDAAYHWRVHRAVKQMEREMIAFENDTFFFEELSQEEIDRRRITYNKRQNRFNNKESGGALVRWHWWPQLDRDGSIYYAVIHNQAKEGGEALPNDYGALYEWLYDAVNTPEGKRTGGSANWGQEYAGAKGSAVARAERDGVPHVTVRGRGIGVRTIAHHFEQELPKDQKITLHFPWQNIVNNLTRLLEAAGGYLQTIDGQAVLPEKFLPLIEYNKQMSLLKDIDSKEKIQQAANIPNLRHLAATQLELTAFLPESRQESPPKPAPIYLNGRWIQ